jgi:hypothetical protein
MKFEILKLNLNCKLQRTTTTGVDGIVTPNKERLSNIDSLSCVVIDRLQSSRGRMVAMILSFRAVCFVSCLTLHLLSTASAFIVPCQNTRRTVSLQLMPNGEGLTRRSLISGIASLVSLLPTLCVNAVEDPAELPQEVASKDRVAQLLHSVPTFTIVDQKGAPFMVVGEDAKVTGYFFTEYGEASRILNLARKSADTSIRNAKKDPAQQGSTNEINPWNKARISTVPLDVAITLSLKSNGSKMGGGNYFQIAPSEQDVEDALAITGGDDLAEGKVPLFYYRDFVVNNQSSLYFCRSQLEQAFKKANPGRPLPLPLVSELFAVVKEMVLSDAKDKEELAIDNLVFVPPRESARKAAECLRKSKEAQFLLGQRNIVL